MPLTKEQFEALSPAELEALWTSDSNAALIANPAKLDAAQAAAYWRGAAIYREGITAKVKQARDDERARADRAETQLDIARTRAENAEAARDKLAEENAALKAAQAVGNAEIKRLAGDLAVARAERDALQPEAIAARKKTEADKAAALAKLTPEQRKLLGLS